MSDDAYSTDGYLTVQRPLGNGTSLYETWKLQNYHWADPGTVDDPVVQCYVADVNEGVPPHSDHCVNGSCSFSDAPESVQEEFLGQLERIGEFRHHLKNIEDDDE